MERVGKEGSFLGDRGQDKGEVMKVRCGAHGKEMFSGRQRTR